MLKNSLVETYLNSPSVFETIKMEQLKESMGSKGHLDKEAIMKIIPYQDPFLFLDEVIELKKDKIVGIKKLSGKEDFFKGHFVGFPIMPGALTVEAMGQAATLLMRTNIKDHKEKHVLAHKLKDVRFTAPIFPGSEMKIEVNLIAMDERGAVAHGKAIVKDNVVAEAYMMLAVVNKIDFEAKFSS